MRISEMTFPKDKETAGEILEKYGYDCLGKGCYANVYHKMGQKNVLKIFHESDYAYMKYVDFCLAHQDNPHFPKLSRKYVKIPNTDYFAIRMEVLEPYLCDSDRILLCIGACISPYTEADIFRVNISFLRAHYPESLVSAVKLLKDFVSKSQGIYEDVGDQNVMMRGTTLVLTDPVCT